MSNISNSVHLLYLFILYLLIVHDPYIYIYSKWIRDHLFLPLNVFLFLNYFLQNWKFQLGSENHPWRSPHHYAIPHSFIQTLLPTFIAVVITSCKPLFLLNLIIPFQSKLNSTIALQKSISSLLNCRTALDSLTAQLPSYLNNFLMLQLLNLKWTQYILNGFKRTRLFYHGYFSRWLKMSTLM